MEFFLNIYRSINKEDHELNFFYKNSLNIGFNDKNTVLILENNGKLYNHEKYGFKKVLWQRKNKKV
jgi:hypothetical protein